MASKEKITRGKGGVGGLGHFNGGDSNRVPLHSGGNPVGHGGDPEGNPAAKPTDRTHQNVVVYGRGPGNWEVLVDGHAVARFDTKAEAFQWAAILQGKEGDHE